MARNDTRTYHHEQAKPAPPPPPQVEDPAVREILRTVDRALSMILAAIRQHNGGEEPPPKT